MWARTWLQLVARVGAVLLHLAEACSSSTAPEFKVVLGDQVFFSDGNASAEARWALSRNWQNLVAVTADETTSALELHRAHERGWHTILAVNANPIELERRAASRNRTATNLSAVVEVQTGELPTGRPLTWEYLCEDDSSGTGFSYDLLKAARRAVVVGGTLAPAEAESLWEGYLSAALESTDAHTHGVDLHRNAKFGFPSNAHAIARGGADTLVLERDNDDVGSLAVGMAFLRGAAVQYNRTWGIDLSLWWGVINGCVNDLPASYHTRTLYMSYVSGAVLVEIEGCGWLDTAPDGSRTPFPISDAVDEFGTFAAHALPASQRGAVDSVVTLVLPSDHGWDEQPSWANTATSWNYANLPTSRGGRAINGMFSTAFPGTDRFSYFAFPFGAFRDGGSKDPPSPFARSAITPKYAPDMADVHYASATLPFGVFNSRKEASSYMKTTRRDPASHRPMVDTRWGGIVDVLVAPPLRLAAPPGGSELTLAALRRYSVVVILGEVVSTTVADTLEQYAHSGGTVIISAGTAVPEHAVLLTGVNFTGELLASRAWSFTNDEESQPAVHEPLLVAAGTVLNDSNTSVLAASLPGQHPMVTRKYIGHGAVYTCLVPWFEGAGRELSGLALGLLDRIITPLQPVTIAENGLPLEWTSTTRTDGTKIVALSNHAEGSWHGSINVKTKCKTEVLCRDLRRNVSCMATEAADRTHVKVPVLIPAYDVAVLELACSGQKHLFAHKTDDTYVSDMNMEFGGGKLVVNTATGSFLLQVMKRSWQNAPYVLWSHGTLLSSHDGSLSLTNFTHKTGNDRLGEFEVLSLSWSDATRPEPRHLWTTSFRCYTGSGPLVFEQTFPRGWTPGIHGDVDTPATAFPSFQLDDKATENLTLVTFRGQNAAQSTHYGRWPASYRGGYLGGPLCFVENTLETALVLSPLDEFMITHHNIKNCSSLQSPRSRCTELFFGAQGMLQQLAPRSKLQFVLSVTTPEQRTHSYAGTVAAGFMHWGDILLQYHQKRRVVANASVAISMLGYSTTGIYHYNPCDCINNSLTMMCNLTSNPQLPGCKTYEDTLLAVHADARLRGLNYSWWLIDSWWHAFDQDEYWEDVPQQVAQLFPHGLQWLSNTTEMSFSAHWSSMFGLSSPYRKIAPESWYCSQKVCIPTDERVWDYIFSSDLKWRLQTIKVDHMLSTLVGSAADNGDGTCPGLLGWPHPGHECLPGERTALIREHSEAVLPCLTSPSVATSFLTALARSAARHHVSIEWCMSYPNVLLTSVATGGASTHARGSDDSHPVGAGRAHWPGTGLSFTSNNWHGFAAESTFLWAIGLYPFKDTFYTNSSVTPQNKHAEDYLGHEPRPFTHALVAALGGGGVANGDPVGSTDAQLLMLTCTTGGRLLKPNVPAMYIDRTWMHDHAVGETALAISSIPVRTIENRIGVPAAGAQRLDWRMIYSINSAGFELRGADVGVVEGEPYVAYSYCGPRPLTRAQCLQPAVHGLQHFDSGSFLRVPAAGDDLEAQFFVVAPVIVSGSVSWALLGEWPKLVPISLQRFESVSATALVLETIVIGNANERVDIMAAVALGTVGPSNRRQQARTTVRWSWRVTTCHFGPNGGRLVARWSVADPVGVCGSRKDAPIR